MIGVVVVTHGQLATELVNAAETIVGRVDALPAFAAGLFRSFWLSAGWVRYFAAPTWYVVLGVLCVAAVIGHDKLTAALLEPAKGGDVVVVAMKNSCLTHRRR